MDSIFAIQYDGGGECASSGSLVKEKKCFGKAAARDRPLGSNHAFRAAGRDKVIRTLALL
jgi:hypothetical protein